MTSPSPFLSLDDRVSYLCNNHYFQKGVFTELDVERIGKMNFHYFLGYARNFRQLHDQNLMSGEKTPAQVLDIIDLDAQISGLLYSGIRQAEWMLRHHTVQAYCQKFSPVGDYLAPEMFLNLGNEYTNEMLAHGLINDILEYSENYVVRNIQSKSKELGLKPPRRCTTSNFSDCQKVLSELPLWAVVDSFSLGRLVKFIQRCDNSEDASAHLWREVAKGMDIPANRFLAGMDSLRSLRNLISHQARLWMRPTTYTASKHGRFRKTLSQCHKKSSIVALYNVASFQGEDLSLEFGAKLETVLDLNQNYRYGVSNFGRGIIDL